MNEALILEKLDKLSDEIRSLKSDVLQEIREDLARSPEQSEPVPAAPVGELGDEFSSEKVIELSRSLLANLEELNEVAKAVKSKTDISEGVGPLVKKVYPQSVEFFDDLEGDFHVDELVILLRKALSNLDAVGEGLDMLKAGVELRDDLVPILQLLYPRLLRFLNSLHEGEFQAEKLGDLLHTILLNIHTLSDLLNMLQPMTELVKELGVLMRETDVLNGMNIWLDGMQQGNGMVKLAGTLFTFFKRLDYSEQQVEDICRVIEGLDFNKAEPVGPIGMIKQFKDPKVQEAFGFFFMLLQAVGSCLQAFQKNSAENNGLSGQHN